MSRTDPACSLGNNGHLQLEDACVVDDERWIEERRQVLTVISAGLIRLGPELEKTVGVIQWPLDDARKAGLKRSRRCLRQAIPGIRVRAQCGQRLAIVARCTYDLTYFRSRFS